MCKNSVYLEAMDYLNRALGYHEALRDVYMIASNFAEDISEDFLKKLEELSDKRYPSKECRTPDFFEGEYVRQTYK